MTKSKGFALAMWLLVAILMVSTAFAQETTAGLQGTVKDPSGAVVSGATVEVAGPALIGTKKVVTDASGYYRFAQLPPGEYTLTVTAKGFKALKQAGLKLNTGALPTVDPKMEVGGTEQTVEVSSAAPIVDVTQSKVETNVEREVISNIPKGRSFQSVIPFAPGARQEPLASRREDAGRANGFQIDGASDSENVYMVEGLNTTNIQDGGVGKNVPMEFVQEVQIKSSSFEAEYGGALGGVVNVVQKRGGPQWHGSAFTYLRSDALNANDQCITTGNLNTTCGLRLVPGSTNNYTTDPTKGAIRTDNPYEYYQQKKDARKIIEPGLEVGGALLKDRLWAFVSYVPTYDSVSRTVNFTGKSNPGPRTFNQRILTQNALSRLDYRLSDKVRLYGAWQYGYSRTSGYYGVNPAGMATPDSIRGQRNSSAGNDPAASWRPDRGLVQPNNILNFGGDWTITPKLIATVRYGYFYQNASDRGLPVGTRYFYSVDSTTAKTIDGAAFPAAYQQTVGTSNIGPNQALLFDQYKRKGLNTDLSWFVGNFFGTHNFKFGYAQNRLSNDVTNGYNTSQVLLYYGQAYTPGTGATVCDPIIAQNVNQLGAAASTAGCRGQYGYYNLSDGVGTSGNVSSVNHALYFQDAWTFRGFTVNAGVRFDKEHLPPYSAGAPSIGFDFADKVAPRVGVAYDVLHNGKLKAYFSYGKFFDIMKYSLPRGSFGGEYWHDCVYTLDDPDYTKIVPASVGGHFCPVSGGASGAITGRLIENQDFRKNVNNATDPGVDPNIKPMQQHEYVAGADWAITPTLGFESRYSRKRLDQTIEDIGVTDNDGFYIGNPGSTYGDLLRRALPGSGYTTAICANCPVQPKAIRDYDGLEFRLTKKASDKWFGSISYTYSKLNGNYAGLASSDVSDGNGGRHSPNNNRSFDQPQMQFDSHGKVIDGPLPTDRPHTVKMFGFYRVKWLKQETVFGITEQVFSGTPLTTCWPTQSTASSCQFVEGRSNWVNLHRDATNGNIVSDGITFGKRTPKFSQMDFNIVHEFKVSKTNENLRVGFEGNVSNVFNQRAVLSVYNNPLGPTTATTTPVTTSNPTGYDFHAMMTGWKYIAVANSGAGVNANNIPNTLASRYGQPNLFQGGRTIRLKLKFTF